MKNLIAVSTAAIAFGSAAPALADGYVSLGRGATAAVSGEIGEHFASDDLDAGRLALGTRLGVFALEASFSTADLRGRSPAIQAGTTGALMFTTRSLGANLKAYFGLLGPLEGYVRGGVNRTWIVSGDDTRTMHDISGPGYDIGGGVQLPLRFVPGVQAAVFADYDRQLLELSDARMGTMEGAADLVLLGVSFGTEL